MRAQLICASSKRGYDEDDFGGCGRKFIAAVFSCCRSGSNAGRQYQHRQADDDCFRERLRQVSLEGFDRAQWLRHADGFMERQVAVARSPLQEIRQCADAVRCVLQRRLCRSRHLRPEAPGPAGLAWLCSPASGQCRPVLLAGAAGRPCQYPRGHYALTEQVIRRANPTGYTPR
ncbi:hypothetical protein RL2819 [Rhizobium johnstonii 3841]|uniref:Uncharacterized protein n=1 Tax=Rhizobium johnstonii (strain DSM 114642 / LMG 32736 / 3841) TaxID=216596 RepID=Q1MFG5_RHIJ3|nr:hypothetical protein RL2819 [Rhizobium johnstonii 3841]